MQLLIHFRGLIYSESFIPLHSVHLCVCYPYLHMHTLLNTHILTKPLHTHTWTFTDILYLLLPLALRFFCCASLNNLDRLHITANLFGNQTALFQGFGCTVFTVTLEVAVFSTIYFFCTMSRILNLVYVVYSITVNIKLYFKVC